MVTTASLASTGVSEPGNAASRAKTEALAAVGNPSITAKTDTSKNTSTLSSIVDSSWLKSTFIISDSDIIIGNEYSKFIRKNRYYTTADFKFTSTAPGMNIAVNPKPQFTRYCDIRSKGKIASRPDVTVGTTGHPLGLGMGRYYSEAIDDNQQRIYLRFGVPKYMPLLLWMAKSFDIDKVVLNNRGVITSALLKAIGLASKFWAIAAAPLLAIGMFAMNVYVQNSRFYSVKDTMYTYWATVENVLNQMVARRTMVPYILQDYSVKLSNSMNREQTISASFVKSLNELLPDVINGETGRISVFTIALRAQAAFNRMQREDYEANLKNTLATDFTGYQETGETSHDTYFTTSKGNATVFTKYLFTTAYDCLMNDNADQKVSLLEETKSTDQKPITEYDSAYTDKDTGEPISLDIDPADPKATIDSKIVANIKGKASTYDKFKEYMLAELSEGAAFAVFNVEHTGSVGESFSNSITNNPIESTFNALSSKSRNLTNFLASAAGIPVVGDVLKLAADAGMTMLSNASFGIANPLLALAYGVNINMPKVWESSAVSMPRASYKLRLMSPYGNAYSQLFNIYLPLAMILAGSLTRATGNSSYTSPFACQLFDRGRVNAQLAMITEVGITRGTSNLAFSKNGHPNAIDVDMTITNLDEVVSLDVNSSGILTGAIDALSPDFSDTPFVSYLNTITAVDVNTQVYRLPMLRLKLAERYMALKAAYNPDPAAMGAYAGSTIGNIPLVGIIKSALANNNKALQNLITL